MTEQPPITYELSTPDEAPAGGRNTKALVVARSLSSWSSPWPVGRSP